MMTTKQKQSERALAVLCDEYAAWNKANGLDLGSADEHLHDESLTTEQRGWLREFCLRWDDAYAAGEDE